MSLLSEKVQTVFQAQQVQQNIPDPTKTLYSTVRTAIAVYNINVNGGAQDVPIVLPLSELVPKDSFVVGIVFDYMEPFVFAGSLEIFFPGLHLAAPNNVPPFNVAAPVPYFLNTTAKVIDDAENVTMIFQGAPATQGIVMYYIMYVL
jgi:hypothetical protein